MRHPDTNQSLALYDRLCARAEMVTHYEAHLTSEVQVQNGETMPLYDASIDRVLQDAR